MRSSAEMKNEAGTALEVRDLHFQYPGENPIRFPDILCARGDHFLILGNSGIGKTTLLHLLGGLLNPTRGSIDILGQPLTALKGSQLDDFRGKNIGIIFQHAHFIQSVSVIENVILAAKFAGKPADHAFADATLNRLGLKARKHSLPSKLSAGEKQRAAIARAIINKPALILADEPTSALDDFHCREVLALLMEEARNVGSSLVLVTHDHRVKESFPHFVNLNAQ